MIKGYVQKKAILFGKKLIKSFGKMKALLYNISDKCRKPKIIK